MSIAQFPTEAHASVHDLRTSLEVGTLTWALIQADYALKGRALPAKITDVQHHERRRYEDAALVALLSMNRDAELFAERSATYRAFDEFADFCQTHDLDWLEDHPANTNDGVETLIGQCAKTAVQRFRDVLTGVYPGLTDYLARLERYRAEGGERLGAAFGGQ